MNRRLTTTLRRVATLRPAVREDVGELKTRQAIDEDARGSLDPFLLLAHHDPQVYPPANQGLPFGPHPHRGFETVTFIRSGALAHHDTGGHESAIEAGGVQWITAGSRPIHAELSHPRSEFAFRRETITLHQLTDFGRRVTHSSKGGQLHIIRCESPLEACQASRGLACSIICFRTSEGGFCRPAKGCFPGVWQLRMPRSRLF